MKIVINYFYACRFRAAILEQENIKLRLELSQLKQETAKLRCMIHASS